MGAIRLFLAIVVVQTHIAVFWFPGLEGAESLLFRIGGTGAVMLFFVVSGFLMSFVLEEKYSGPGGTRRFYWARFLRIYPLWWAMLAIVVVAFPTARAFWFNSPLADNIATIALFGADWRIALLDFPMKYDVMPGPVGIGWSLAIEVSFYLVAPFLLRSSRVVAAVFAACAVFRLVVFYHLQRGEPWDALADLFFPGALPFFLAGHLARKAWPLLRLDDRIGPLLLPMSVACIASGQFGYFHSLSFYAGIALFALALPPVFALTKGNRLMNFAGDLTYPLYLVHIPVMRAIPGGFAMHAAAALPFAPTVNFAIAATVGGLFFLACAAATRYLIEIPARYLVAAVGRVALIGLRRLRLAPSGRGDEIGPPRRPVGVDVGPSRR